MSDTIYLKKFFFDWPALLPANVTKEGGAEIEDIATGPQNTQLMTMLSQKKTQMGGQPYSIYAIAFGVFFSMQDSGRWQILTQIFHLHSLFCVFHPARVCKPALA